jgi:uncharacterized protein (DUF1684 family)
MHFGPAKYFLLTNFHRQLVLPDKHSRVPTRGSFMEIDKFKSGLGQDESWFVSARFIKTGACTTIRKGTVETTASMAFLRPRPVMIPTPIWAFQNA